MSFLLLIILILLLVAVLPTCLYSTGWGYYSAGCFFFQAEDGIRAADVTGVQTCALPIFVTRLEQRNQRGRDRLGGPGCDEDLAVGVVLQTVEPPLMIGDRRAQLWDPWPGWVLITPARQDGVGGGLRDLARPIGVGETLAEVDRSGRDRECGHLREDRRSHPGEPAVQQRPAHR